MDVIALDKVQKGMPITPEEQRDLRKKRLIEGRSPNLHVSAGVAAKTDTRADYIRKHSLDKAHFKALVTAYLKTYHEAKRSDIEDLLFDKVSDALDDERKYLFIRDLLQEMRKEGTIRTVGRTKAATWVLTSDRSRGA